MMFNEHVNLKYKHRNLYSWAEQYYVNTVDFNSATIQKYIWEQEKNNLIMDKLYVYLFNGSR